MKRINLYIALILLLSLGSCEYLATDVNPGKDQASIFEEFWKTFDEKYGIFDAKGVDWMQVYNENRPLISNTISDDSLFNVMGRMVLLLRDSHTNLDGSSSLSESDFGAVFESLGDIDTLDFEQIDPFLFRSASFDNLDGFPNNLDTTVITENYLNGNVEQAEGMLYTILEANVGYIVYRDFTDDISDESMDQVLTALADTEGVILDVRGNPGGSPAFAEIMASHFTDQPVTTGFERFKTGPGPNDFSDSQITIEPADGVLYTKPVAVLTNRECYSATTTLIYSMNPMPNVIFMGGRTGGGSGSVADGHLANGWIYSLSISEFIDFEGRHLDDGFDPDIMVGLDENDKTKDEIIERALLELGQ